MKEIEDIMKQLRKEMFDMTFPEIIRQARDRIGLKQYRTAEHLGIYIERLKNLETGYFRIMPKEKELDSFCRFFELPKSLLADKAKKHVEQRKIDLKTRNVHNGKGRM